MMGETYILSTEDAIDDTGDGLGLQARSRRCVPELTTDRWRPCRGWQAVCPQSSQHLASDQTMAPS